MPCGWRHALLLGLLSAGCAAIAGLDEDFVGGGSSIGASSPSGSGGSSAAGGAGATGGSAVTGLTGGGTATGAGGVTGVGGDAAGGDATGGSGAVGAGGSGGGAGASGGGQGGDAGAGGAAPTVHASCLEVLTQGHSTGNHAYAIHTPAGARQLFCDMAVDGGGWTLVGQIAGKFDNFDSWLRTDVAESNLATAVIEPGVYSCVNAVPLAVEHASEIRLSNSVIDRWVKWPLHPNRSLTTWWNHAAGYSTIVAAADSVVAVQAFNGTTANCYQNVYGIMPFELHGGSYPAAPRNEAGNTTPNEWCMAVGVMRQGTTAHGFSQNNNGWDAPSAEDVWPNVDYNSAPVVSVWLR